MERISNVTLTVSPQFCPKCSPGTYGNHMTLVKAQKEQCSSCGYIISDHNIFNQDLLQQRIDQIEAFVKQYQEEGGKWFSIKGIDMLRDGGTIVIDTTHDKRYRIDKDDKTLSSGGEPVSDAEKYFLTLRIKAYLNIQESRVELIKRVLFGL